MMKRLDLSRSQQKLWRPTMDKIFDVYLNIILEHGSRIRLCLLSSVLNVFIFVLKVTITATVDPFK